MREGGTMAVLPYNTPFNVPLVNDVQSGLLAIDSSHAHDYATVLTAFGHQLPAGWNPRAEHGTVVGWDLVLVRPRTLSVLSEALSNQFLAEITQLRRGRGDLAAANRLLGAHQVLTTAHHRTVELVVERFAEAAHIPPPKPVDHPLDSARQPLLHTHAIVGALSEGGRRRPHDPDRLGTLAQRAVTDYHDRLRDGLAVLVTGWHAWGPVGADGKAELVSLPAGLVATRSARPIRPLGEIAACARAAGDLEVGDDLDDDLDEVDVDGIVVAGPAERR
jgi:hypothetical protein